MNNNRNILREYINKYDNNDGKIALKAAHIFRVADISKKIAISLNLQDEDIKLAENIGLLHDIGRFEQVKRFNTFNDCKSINHAEFGIKVLFEEGLIKEFDIDEKYYKIIKLAILNHNRSKIEDGLSPQELLHCKIIRDSDKLDIFYVVNNDPMKAAYDTDSMENETFSDDVVTEFHRNHVINYEHRKTLGDLWVCQMAYVYDFYFPSSYKVLKEKDYINKLYKRMNFKNEKTKVQASEILKCINEYIDRHVSD